MTRPSPINDPTDERVTRRDEWSPVIDARHQFEAREHGRVSKKRGAPRAAASRETRQLVRDPDGR